MRTRGCEGTRSPLVVDGIKNLYIKFYIKELIILIMYIEFDVQNLREID